MKPRERMCLALRQEVLPDGQTAEPQRITQRSGRGLLRLTTVLAALRPGLSLAAENGAAGHAPPTVDYWSLLFVFALATFIGLGIIRRVSRLLHTPLMSITNAISAIAVVGSILVAGSDYPAHIRILGAVALFASMTNIVSGFLITDRMLKMYKTEPATKAPQRDNEGDKS